VAAVASRSLGFEKEVMAGLSRLRQIEHDDGTTAATAEALACIQSFSSFHRRRPLFDPPEVAGARSICAEATGYARMQNQTSVGALRISAGHTAFDSPDKDRGSFTARPRSFAKSYPWAVWSTHYGAKKKKPKQ
jgi:hypothetical protein